MGNVDIFMAKLVVSELDSIVNDEKKTLCQIIGRLINYDVSEGIFTLESIYDKSRCKIHIDMETETEKWSSLPTFLEGEIVQIQSATFFNGSNRVIMCQMIESIKLPGILNDKSETILKFSNLK